MRKGIEKGLDAVMINPASIVGAYDRTGWARAIRLIAAEKLPGVPPGTASFCHVDEVAKAHIAAAERGGTGENYLLGGVDASFLEFMKVIGEVTGRKVPDKAKPAWLLRMVGRVGHWFSFLTGKPPTLTPETVGLVTRKLVCDCSKAERELGYQAVPLDVMVEESYNWLKAEGLLSP